MWTENQKQKLELLRGRFIEYLMAVNYSPATLVNYCRDARVFFLDWLTENTALNSIADVTAAHLSQYQISLLPPRNGRRKTGRKKQRLSSGAQANKLAAMKRFFLWLWQEGVIVHNPSASIQMPKQPKMLPRNILTPAEAKRLIESIPIEKARDIRDRSILEVMYATGIRRAELVSLTIYDVEMQTGTLRIEHGKGNETRLVPLTQSSQTALKLYLEQARTAFASQPGQIRLFVSSRSGGPLDVDDIRRIVRKWTKNANIKKNVTPHTMRHSCATHLLKGRADIRQIQKLLGHRRLSSTEIYTHVELGDLAEVISRCHPREKSGR
ncbi:MAG: tyrosine-type recombinase/integrase [Ignavibacteria bacterium]|nr:tyrosine-type recombinase/integrase [Ignavibacteria bacterium]